MRKITFACLAIISSTFLTSCMATMHTVGSGGKGNCKDEGQYDAKKKQWYWLFGLVPINHVDSKDLAGGVQNYTIRTTTTFVDGLIQVPGAYLLGFRSQTIRVSKGDK